VTGQTGPAVLVKLKENVLRISAECMTVYQEEEMSLSKQLPKVLLLICIIWGGRPGSGWAGDLELSLDEVVDIALVNNPQVEIATQQCLQGQGIFTQAKSGYLPRVNLGGDLKQQYLQDALPEDEDQVGHASVSLSQLIYDFGKTTGVIDSSRFSLQAAQSHLHQLMQDVVFRVRAAFYSVLEKKGLVVVAQEAVSNYEKHLYRAKRYYQAGVQTKIDVTNAQVNLSNAKLDLLQAQANLQSARVDLENSMGLQPNKGQYTLINEAGVLGELAQHKPAMEQSLDPLMETAFTRRADIEQVNLLVKASQSDITRAKSGYFPSIGATAAYDDYETDLAAYKDQWYLGVGLTWEIFSGFETKGEMIEARARFRELQAALHELELAVTQEVTDSYLRADEYRQAVDLADESMKLAQENLALAEGRYKAGLNDMIEFNDAQLSLTQAQSNLVTTYYAYLTALARIENTVGVTRGLETREGDGMGCDPLVWQRDINR
jgi:outer membrane protein